MSASSPIYDRAAGYVDTIKAALIATADPQLLAVLVTLDPLVAPKAAPAGVVIVSPPAIDWETFSTADLDWQITVIGGPAQDMLAAWNLVDRILEAIRKTDLPLTSALPGGYTPPSQAITYPTYVLTLNDSVIYTEEPS